MKSPTGFRIARAGVLAGFAALILATHVFVTIDRVRVKLVEAPIDATSGLVRVTTADFAQVYELRAPFALIARVANGSAGTATFSVAVDGATICDRSIAGGRSRRLDCAVTTAWNRALEHELTIQGPNTAWRLEYLELATHHGNTDGAHTVMVLPAWSREYVRPAVGWVVAAFVLLAAILLVPAPARLPRGIRVLHGVVVGAILLELAVSLFSEWLSNYRIVISAGTLTVLLVVLCAPQLWALGLTVARARVTDVLVRSIKRHKLLAGAVATLVACGLVAWQLSGTRRQDRASSKGLAGTRQFRQALLDELRPVTLKNCRLRRFGGQHDGGYLMCENLIKGAESAYSYGIAGEDNWGCDLSKRITVPVHQYDCFDTRQPACENASFVFHPECIGPEAATLESRPYDTLTNQISRNGDAGKRLIVKIDVEGAEWDSLLETPDSVLDRIWQLPMELHGTDNTRSVELIRKLKRTFHLVHIHFNNWACTPSLEPFPSEAFQVLFVNKRIGILDESAPPPTLPNPADAPDNPAFADCQLTDVRKD